jgi:DNA-binding SARP family transcriptional activator
MPSWRIYLLGQMEIHLDGRALPHLPTRKAKSLFSFLVLHHQRAWSRDSLAHLLWEDLDEASARKCLRNELWRIRHLLDAWGPGAGGLQIDNGSVRFAAPAGAFIDVARFEEALRDDGEACGNGVARLCEAIELYRGDLLEGCEEEWCHAPRERLRQVFLTSLERLLDHHSTRRDWQAAICCARRILHCDPLLEHVERKLMLCYWQLGDRARALREYAAFADLLQRELQVEPMAETREIYRRIRGALPCEPSAPQVGQLLSRLDLLQRDLEETARSLRRVILDFSLHRR